MTTVNIKASPKCAACKHWYDPSQLAISPKAPRIGLWTVDESMRNKCLIRGIEMKSMASCNQFVNKLF